MKLDLVILDFDGVIVDSELVACGVLASLATELGHPLAVHEAVSQFGGLTIPQQVSKLETLAGRAIGQAFEEEIQRRTLHALDSVLPIPAVEDFLDFLGPTPFCIGSTSTVPRIETCLRAIGLQERFVSRIFSASMVARNKPFPDIFLHCAQEMRAAPERTIVIEDSCHGIEAAVAAGMHAIGLTAASHLKPNHYLRLEQCGARRTFQTFHGVQEYLRAMCGQFARSASAYQEPMP